MDEKKSIQIPKDTNCTPKDIVVTISPLSYDNDKVEELFENTTLKLRNLKENKFSQFLYFKRWIIYTSCFTYISMILGGLLILIIFSEKENLEDTIQDKNWIFYTYIGLLISVIFTLILTIIIKVKNDLFYEKYKYLIRTKILYDLRK